MILWMLAAQMAECGNANYFIRNEIEACINALIEDCMLGDYKGWAVITIILNEHSSDYKEIVRR